MSTACGVHTHLVIESANELQVTVVLCHPVGGEDDAVLLLGHEQTQRYRQVALL